MAHLPNPLPEAETLPPLPPLTGAPFTKGLWGSFTITITITVTVKITVTITVTVVVLLDLGLPDSVGLDIFKAMHAAAGGVHIVVLSGRDDLELANECIAQGAHDYLVKGQVFEPVFTTKEKGKGTGLGSATVYGIVKQSEGNIWVESEEGKGTTFEIYLPRVGEKKASATTQEVRPVSSRGHETVLVVEDEEAVRELAKRILESAGYRVLSAANGGAALLECESHQGPIHLLLTDVVMPKMSGKDLAGRLEGTLPGMKVLFMSGYTDNAIVHHGVLDEGTPFISKPFDIQGLLNKVREVLDS